MTQLARRLGFFSLIVYGIGDILGAGIYALVGKVVDVSGNGAWLSFLLASILAGLTALSYAELTARYPVSAGAAAFIRRGFPGKFFGLLAGVFVLGTGLASAATVAVAFGEYLQNLTSTPPLLAQILLLASLSFLSFWGIEESSRINLLLTLVEMLGLGLVIVVGMQNSSIESWDEWRNHALNFEFSGVLSGITLAFYAYIGFEDLANLAEECKNPQRDLPRAILISLSVATLLYLSVTLILQSTLSASDISHSKTPLLLIFEKAQLGWALRIFPIIAMIAITNTGLINLIIASRLLYGMAQEDLLPKHFAHVHKRRKTPYFSIITVFLMTSFLVVTGGLRVLAQTTSLLIVTVFLGIHLSLLKIKSQKSLHTGMSVSWSFPLLGTLLCLGLMTQFSWEIYLRSCLLIGCAIFLWLWNRRRPLKANNGAQPGFE